MPQARTDPAYVRQARAYLRLRHYWRRDPVAYVGQRFGATPTGQQQQILHAIAPPGAKVSVRSGHGIGKTTCAAWIVLWHLETHNYAKVPCTAPSSHQLRDVLWGELARWRRQADAQSAQRGDHPALYLSALFALTQDRLVDVGAPDWGAFGRTARKENPEALQGFHAQHLLFVVDEASGVDEAIYEAAEGALSTPFARVLLLGNPTRTSGTFYASHHTARSSFTALHFRSQDSPLVAPAYRERLVTRWGEGSNVVKVRADGDFPRQEDDMLISLELTEPCLTRERGPGTGPRLLGVDPARYGDDRTAFVLRRGRRIEHLAVHRKMDTMQTVGQVLAVLDPWRVDVIYVDTIGLGAGVFDRLEELRTQGTLACRLVAVNVAEKAPDKPEADAAQGRLLRDWLWLRVATWLRDDFPIIGAQDEALNDELAGELASVKLRFDSDGCLVVESKDDMKRRLGHSPDLADALCCTFAPVVQPLGLFDMSRGLDRAPRGWRDGTPRARFGGRLFQDELDDLPGERESADPTWEQAKTRVGDGTLRPGGPYRPERG
jgi:phage terminase large subunit